MPTRTKNLVLLTGAGFTYNFGGFLAREMWSKIFNNPSVQSHPKLRELLQRDFDFESIYFAVLRGQYTPEEKEALRQAVENAYKDLDDNVKNWEFNGRNPTELNTHGLGGFISFMSERGSDKGWFFTLNQDLFMERKKDFRSPGASFPRPFIDRSEGGGIQTVVLPKDDSMEAVKGTLNNTSYIKLHGSYGWVSSNGGTQMVIGKNKAEDITREPLLKWYAELFEQQIYEGNKKLLIIGYGFGDKHINDVLLRGVREHGLSIYIINPTDPESIKKILEGYHEGIYEIAETQYIWKGVRGYFPYTLRQIFPPDQSETTMLAEIKKALTN